MHRFVIPIPGIKQYYIYIVFLDKSDIDIDLEDNGTIKLKYRGEWRSVCANHWTNIDAKVACRQLNPQLYTSEGLVNLIVALHKNVTVGGMVLSSMEVTSGVKIWMDFVNCKGDEESLFECDYIIVNGKDMPCNMRARVMCII